MHFYPGVDIEALSQDFQQKFFPAEKFPRGVRFLAVAAATLSGPRH